MNEEERIYKEATKRIDEMVQEVFTMCDTVADLYDYEKEWVFERFRERFNKAKRENT